MDAMVSLLVIRVNYEKTMILINIQKSLFVEQIVLTFSLVRKVFFKYNKFEKGKAFKREASNVAS